MSELISLPDKLDFARAEWLYSTLASMRGSSVTLDAQSVRSLGGVCAQVLLAAVRQWKNDGHKLSLMTSEPFLADLRLLGVHDMILADAVVK